MPTIGSFSQDDLFGQEGILETPTLKARIKFVPLRDRSGKQPDYRILSGKREIGGAWSRTSKSGDAYLFLKLADPSQPAPVCCNLYRNTSGPAVLCLHGPVKGLPRKKPGARDQHLNAAAFAPSRDVRDCILREAPSLVPIVEHLTSVLRPRLQAP